ncbi:ATP-dependent DNA helicase [Trichonephila clavipes]|nr:ATP-dependent DNA helicase [Trichonephila clavipes]
MVHGPCGSYNPRSPCMKNGICSKRFPKPFSTETVTGEGGYPFYRRRSPENSGIRTAIQSRANCIDIDNRLIVPFSPVLSRTFRAHINVELCSSIKSIKYICKYVNKGSDLAVFGVQNANDEVTSYQNGRYISTSEAIWRMLSFLIHERFSAVTHLVIHLENGQIIYFDPRNVRTVVENPRNTTFMAFFDLCHKDEFAASLLYEEIPGGNTLPHYGLPFPQEIDGIVENLNREYFEHTNFDPVELQHMINQNEPRLNKEQNQVYRLLTDSVNANAGGAYFLDAPGGTGKTFFINLLLAKIRSEKRLP